MRLQLLDPTLLDEFVEFLARSGFVAEPEGPDAVRVALPLTPGPGRTPSEIGTLLEIWVTVGLRIWDDLHPESGALVVREAERRAA